MPGTRLTALCLLLLAGLSLVFAGCSSGGEEQPTTSLSSAGATTTLTDSLSATERELADNYDMHRSFAAYLTKDKADDDDPRRAILYGLQARTQALSCLDALDAGLLEVADDTMPELNQMMNQAQKIAADTVKQTLADARLIIATMGLPSEAPQVTAALLGQFVVELAPLLDAATQSMSAPTTIPSTTST